MKEPWAERLGTVTLEPCVPVEAGSYQQWTLTLKVGSYGIDERGTIKIAQRFACDMQPAQFDDPQASAYCTVSTDGAARLAPRFAPKGHDRPWMRWCLVIDVYDGSLAPGDTVTVVLGERGGGSPGIRVQTFIESAHEFRVFVDPTNASVARAVAASPKFAVVAGKAAELVCIAPSQSVVDEVVEVFVKGQDIWGNPTPVEGAELAWEGSGEVAIEGRRISLQAPGMGRLVASVNGLSCYSNSIEIFPGEPRWRRYWGDLHAQSDATVGVGTEEEYFAFARDWARVDFASHQGNDFQVDDEDWRRLNQVVEGFHRDGEFVVFPGYEWSANSPAGGDRNVFYRREGLPIIRNSHWQIPHVIEDDISPAHPGDVFFAKLAELVPKDQYIIGSHVGGRWADVKAYFDPGAHNLVEVVSGWGVFEWMLFDALDCGHVVGVMCNSDGHKGRPGAEGPGAGEFGIAGGLTCVLAEELTREGVWEALCQRRCYGTTGARIHLDMDVAGVPMGAEVTATGTVEIRARAVGAAPLEALQLYCGREIVAQIKPPEFGPQSVLASNTVRLVWSGSQMRGRGRRVDWSGTIRAEGAAIVAANTVSFDSAADGITDTAPQEVTFQSQTTGDADGIELVLEDGRQGRLIFDSAAGATEIDLAELGGEPLRFDYGGLDMQLVVQRYPERVETLELAVKKAVQVLEGRAAYFVKAVQCDGQMAWSSPVYVSG
ncbi:MAG: DUF3604 domain-containing protein [Candidatus Latescibacteria bacterium]|nr:DUF3604 domain-containing protein [Candidatus Latescibacterota bacterium]